MAIDETTHSIANTEQNKKIGHVITRLMGGRLAGDKDSRAYSVRLAGADLRRLKAVSERLGVTESDLIRFALRHVLGRLSPLHDIESKGASLLPVFVEFGNELTSYFDLDESRLEGILNDGIESDRRVDREDVGLLLMAGLEVTRLYARLSEVTDLHNDPETVMEDFRKYLYSKYLFRKPELQQPA